MKIILAMVLSADGKSTKWDLPDQSWASAGDKIHLSKLIAESDVIIMGSNTYSIARSHIKPGPGKLRVVMTRFPEKFKDDEIKGQLEFSGEDPKSLIDRLSNEGLSSALLLSGHKLNKVFFEEKLIDKLILTIEPKIFGEGFGVLDSVKLDINLKLESVEKLNDAGTLLLEYEVLKK